MIWNHEAETMSREARERLQLERLGETIAWAVARVLFHRDRLSGVTVRGLPDLVELPFVHKSDLREHYPFGLLAVATLCLLIGLGGIAWILTLVEGLVAAVAATTGVHLAVSIRDRLWRR